MDDEQAEALAADLKAAIIEVLERHGVEIVRKAEEAADD